MSAYTQLEKLRGINEQVERLANSPTTLLHMGFLSMILPSLTEDQREVIMQASFIVRDAHYDQGMEEAAELIESIAAGVARAEQAEVLRVASRAIRDLVAKNRADRTGDHPNG